MLILEGPKAAVTAVSFSLDGEELVVGGREGPFGIVTIPTGVFLPLGSESPGVTSIAIDPAEGGVLFNGGVGWKRFERDPDRPWELSQESRGGPVAALAYLNETTLVLGYGDRRKLVPGQIELWNLTTGERLKPFFREPSGVRAVAVHLPSHTVAWSNAANRVSVWNTLTLEPRHIGLTHTSPGLSFSADGERLAVAQEWGVKVYEVATRDEKLILKGHTGRVTAVAYSPDGKVIVTSSWDQTVRVWDAASGASRVIFDWGIGKVFSLAFAPDGLRLAAGGENGLIAVWDVE